MIFISFTLDQAVCKVQNIACELVAQISVFGVECIYLVTLYQAQLAKKIEAQAVTFEVECTNDIIKATADFETIVKSDTLLEPVVKAIVLTPVGYLETILELLNERKEEKLDMLYHDHNAVSLVSGR